MTKLQYYHFRQSGNLRLICIFADLLPVLLFCRARAAITVTTARGGTRVRTKLLNKRRNHAKNRKGNYNISQNCFHKPNIRKKTLNVTTNSAISAKSSHSKLPAKILGTQKPATIQYSLADSRI